MSNQTITEIDSPSGTLSETPSNTPKRELLSKFYVCTDKALLYYMDEPTVPYLLRGGRTNKETPFENGHFGMMFQGYSNLHFFESSLAKMWTRADAIERMEFLLFIRHIQWAEELCIEHKDMELSRHLLHKRVLVGDWDWFMDESDLGVLCTEEEQKQACELIMERCLSLGLEPEAVFGKSNGVLMGVNILKGKNTPQ